MIERSFTHAGLRCAVVLHERQGHRCGYVLVPEGHPWHGLGYRDEVPNPLVGVIDNRDVEKVGYINAFCIALGDNLREYERRLEGQVGVHGGLTYAAEGLPGSKPEVAGWWIGFDCAHADDTPTFWTEERVVDEVKRLADQVAAGAVTEGSVA